MKSMRQSKLDVALDQLQAKVADLSRRQQCAFFVVCGEGLFPLYERFSKETGWGSPEALRHAAKAAWSYAEGGAPLSDSAPKLLKAIADATPDGERFDAPASTFAQDATICFDAAVRAATLHEEIKPAWVEYAIEPSTVSACQEETGFIDMGTSPEADEWRDEAINHPRVQGALQCCNQIVELIKGKHSLTEAERLQLRRISAALL